MTNLSVIENKISQVQKYLGILKFFQKYGRTEIEDEISIRGAVERYLYLAIQSAIDLAEDVIAYRHLRKPSSQGEAFEILAEANLLDLDLTKALVKMCGFRNLIAHNYERLNYDIVYEVLHDRLSDIEKFIKKIEEEK